VCRIINGDKVLAVIGSSTEKPARIICRRRHSAGLRV